MRARGLWTCPPAASHGLGQSSPLSRAQPIRHPRVKAAGADADKSVLIVVHNEHALNLE